MLVMALGQAGTGKSRLLRQLAWGRLASSTQCSILVHDPFKQWRGGEVFATCREARRAIAERRRLPRLTLVRADSADAVCRLAWDIGQITCVIDELDQVCSSKRWVSEAARQIVHYGRHREVDLFGSFRFTRNVNEDIPSRANYIFLMRHSGAALADLELLRRRLGAAYADTVTTLVDHECLVWSEAQAS